MESRLLDRGRGWFSGWSGGSDSGDHPGGSDRWGENSVTAAARRFSDFLRSGRGKLSRRSPAFGFGFSLLPSLFPGFFSFGYFSPTLGILGLQGCCRPHEGKLAELQGTPRRVVHAEGLRGLHGLVIPGGESTTMLKTAPAGLWGALQRFAETRPVWGICAGCILMARHVANPTQVSLGLMDVDVVRNAYGAQNESFVATLSVRLSAEKPYECLFIRAPQISRVGDQLTVLARHRGDPVMVAGERHLVTTFHPELMDGSDFHRYFLDLVRRHGGP